MDQSERVLWERLDGDRLIVCVMRSCCAGAELQVRVAVGDADDRITMREMYPTKSDLYERARQLEQELEPGAAGLPSD